MAGNCQSCVTSWRRHSKKSTTFHISIMWPAHALLATTRGAHTTTSTPTFSTFPFCVCMLPSSEQCCEAIQLITLYICGRNRRLLNAPRTHHLQRSAGLSRVCRLLHSLTLDKSHISFHMYICGSNLRLLNAPRSRS